MKELYIDTKKKIYRSTAILFVVQLFGALGAGFFFVIQNLFGTYHILGATGADQEPILWFILFWATDFFVVALVLVLSYLIAGIPAIAPALSLSVYFCHFSFESVKGADTYFAYFATPVGYEKTMAIGYMGYFIMAILLSLLIKYLFAGWTAAKEPIGRGIDKLLKKFKGVPDTLKGIMIIEGVDLIVLILIVPVVSCALTYILIKYGIEIPFGAAARFLGEQLSALAANNVILAAIIMGLMVGFDLIGPMSMAAYYVAAVSLLSTGDPRLMTIYSACFITAGWTAFFSVIWNKVFKKGGKTDTDDFNITVSGPINAFFENIKLANAFSMTYAYRSPLTVIPGLMSGSAFAGLLTALFKIVNTAYVDGSLPKYTTGNYTAGAVDYTYAQLFECREIYMSFTLPLRSGDWLSCRIPLLLIILVSGMVGGLVIMGLKHWQYKFEVKRGLYSEPDGDMVIEMRNWGKKLLSDVKVKKEG